MNHIRGFIRHDRILPESYEEKLESNPHEPIQVSMKLLNYGSEKNFLIRPAQQLEIHHFDQDKKLKATYCQLKCLKMMLKVDLSSYFIKKVLLSNRMQEKLQINSFNDIYEALQHPDLRATFNPVICYQEWGKYYPGIPTIKHKK